ncbi:acyl-CoA-binding domain-containing protein 1-like protein [Tanacetum coccineum]
MKDNKGQTPLHYAIVCERKEIGELLVKRNAGTDIQDNDGNYPCRTRSQQVSATEHLQLSTSAAFPALLVQPSSY